MRSGTIRRVVFIAGSLRSVVARWLPVSSLVAVVVFGLCVNMRAAFEQDWLACAAITSALSVAVVASLRVRSLSRLAERERKARLVAHQPRRPSTAGWMRVEAFGRN